MARDRLTFKCARCGSGDFKIPENPKPNDVVTCAGCGASAYYRDVQAKAIKLARQRIEAAFRDIFKKRR